MKTDDKALPESSASYDGATGVTLTDMKRGFSREDQQTTDTNVPEVMFLTQESGFLTRPHGWER